VVLGLIFHCGFSEIPKRVSIVSIIATHEQNMLIFFSFMVHLNGILQCKRAHAPGGAGLVFGGGGGGGGGAEKIKLSFVLLPNFQAFASTSNFNVSRVMHIL